MIFRHPAHFMPLLCYKAYLIAALFFVTVSVKTTCCSLMMRQITALKLTAFLPHNLFLARPTPTPNN